MVDKRPTIEISVRKLVEFVLCSGDIDDRVGSVDPVKAMQEGTKAHQKIQRAAGSEYHAEVPFVYYKDYENYDLKVSGRADGVIDGHTITIDEIKGVYDDLDLLSEPKPLHIAQAKCYAFFYSEQHEKCDMSVRMTYVNLDTYKVRYFLLNFTYEELDAFFSHVLSLYKRWADFLFEWQKKRNESIQKLIFPYDFRPGQKDLISKIYYSISKEKILFMQAPTGTGKTLATIFPSVKAIGNSYASKLFYLTAKNVTRNVAFNAFKILAENGLSMKSVMITAKEKLCINTEVKCDPDHCIYAKGHFDRVNDSVYALLMGKDMFGPEEIIEHAKEHTVCPYYMNLDLSRWCDAIVCDYNYVFDPNAALSQFFTEGIGQDFIFLIDEAHNLVERGREMYSASLIKEEVLKIKKDISTTAFGIVAALTKLNTAFLNIKKSFENQALENLGLSGSVLNAENSFHANTQGLEDTEHYLVSSRRAKNKAVIKKNSYALEKYYESNAYFHDPSERADFESAVGRVVFALSQIFEKKIPLENEDEILEFYFNIRFFDSISTIADSHYRFYFSYDEEKHLNAHLFCMDPSKNIQEHLDMGVSTVFFSATLIPMEYYKRLLCLDEKPFALFAESTFPPENKKIFIGSDVTSLYKKRSNAMYRAYSDYIIKIINSRCGNYMAFFPSYGFMNEVLNYFYADYSGSAEILVQESNMKEDEKKAFLNTFEKKQNVIAFSVSGGAFSEGIDLTGDSLIGVIICGAALPKYSVRQKILQDYFNENSLDGFSYAYIYPGMNKVLQAAGRVIRTESDCGIIVLLDERFKYSSYKNNFPPDWDGHIENVTRENVKEKIMAFWDAQALPGV